MNEAIQKLDIRLKLLFLIISSFSIIFINNKFSLAVIFSFGFILLCLSGRYKLIAISYLLISLMMGISIFFLFLMSLFIKKSPLSLTTMVVPFSRVGVSFNFLLLLTMSNTKEIFSFLRSVKLPLFITLPILVMIRFLPSFLQDVKQVKESLKIRGYSLNPLTLTFRPLLSVRIILMPLLIRALRISENLSIAAELKGLTTYSSLQISQSKKLNLKEYLLIGTFLFMIILSIINNITNSISFYKISGFLK